MCTNELRHPLLASPVCEADNANSPLATSAKRPAEGNGPAVADRVQDYVDMDIDKHCAPAMLSDEAPESPWTGPAHQAVQVQGLLHQIDLTGLVVSTSGRKPEVRCPLELKEGGPAVHRWGLAVVCMHEKVLLL
jgi:hypothetical protein